jgi:deoxyribodipyrimidine photo-lyase
LLAYGESRDYPALASTSQLSPHLHFGTVNIRTILAAIHRAVSPATPEQRVQAEVFRTELIWREFYLQILTHFPRVAQGCYRTEYDALEWSDNQDHFQAWQNGLTGYPIIDAAMRCLNATGWMHNRNRMIVAMFLTKDLLLPWSAGERYFMQKLVDGDLAANNGGWQWCAGTGTDAAPYFRIFNPITQGQKFDPEGEFVRHWIPELASLAGRTIHEPWLVSPTARQGYPDRVVDHNLQRKKCLAMFAQV